MLLYGRPGGRKPWRAHIHIRHAATAVTDEVVMNCWEAKKCGRQANGAKVAELGVCPAYTKNAGQACWLVAGTFCGGVVQGSFAQKEQNCMKCEFYKQFDLQHRSAMRKQFAS